MDKVYIVIKESFICTAFGYDIIKCFSKEEDAKACIKDLAEDFIKICDEGGPDGFDEYTISNNSTSITITDKYGDFESFCYNEIILQ